MFAGAQLGIALVLLTGSEILHHRSLRRGADPQRTRRSRAVCRVTVGALLAIGLLAFSAPSYHPLLGEHYLREALAATERERPQEARAAFRRAIHHLGRVEEMIRGGGLYGGIVRRFVEPWGGFPAVIAALGTANFMLGDCKQALPYLRRELSSRPAAARTARLSYRLAVCHLEGGRDGAAEEALLRALLIDRRYAEKARRHPGLKPLAEALLAKRL